MVVNNCKHYHMKVDPRQIIPAEIIVNKLCLISVLRTDTHVIRYIVTKSNLFVVAIDLPSTKLLRTSSN